MLLALVSAAILSRYFDKTDYGSYRQIIFVYSSLVIVFSAGLPNIFSYFLPRIDKSEGKELVNRVTFILFILGLCFGLFLFFGANKIAWFMGNQEITPGIKRFSIVPVLLLPSLGIDGIFASYQQTYMLAIYNTINRLLMLSLIILPVIFIDNTLNMAIDGWILASCVSLILSFWFRNLPFRKLNRKIASISTKEIFSYSVPLVLASLYGLLIRYSDQFYISHYFGPEVYAEFSNGFIDIPFVGMITSATSTVLMPLFSSLRSINDTSQIVRTWMSTLEKSAIIIYPIVFFCLFFSNEIMVLIFSNQYYNSGIYFRVNIFVNFFNIIVFMPIILAFGKTKFYSNLHLVFAIWAWFSGWVVIYLFHTPLAIAICSVINSILIYLVAFFYASKLINVNFFKLIPLNVIGKIFIQCVVPLLIIKFIIQFCNINVNLIVLFLIGSCYLLSIYIFARFLKIDLKVIASPLINKLRINF